MTETAKDVAAKAKATLDAEVEAAAPYDFEVGGPPTTSGDVNSACDGNFPFGAPAPNTCADLVEAAGDITKIDDNLTADRVGLHRLFDAMEEKLHAKSLEGRGGWNNDCTVEDLERMLKEHIDKPWTPRNLVDIANFCMMIWNRHRRFGEREKP